MNEIHETVNLSVSIWLLSLLFVLYFVSSLLLTICKVGHVLSWLQKIVAIIALSALANFVWIGNFRPLVLLHFSLEALEPFLLKIFGVGGQGFLHLASLYFIDVSKLDCFEITWRVFAGLYTFVLSAVFLIPVLVILCVYLVQYAQAFHAETDIVLGDDEEPTIELSLGQLFQDFNMSGYEVLASLGNGATCNVTLVRKIKMSVQSPKDHAPIPPTAAVTHYDSDTESESVSDAPVIEGRKPYQTFGSTLNLTKEFKVPSIKSSVSVPSSLHSLGEETEWKVGVKFLTNFPIFSSSTSLSLTNSGIPKDDSAMEDTSVAQWHVVEDDNAPSALIAIKSISKQKVMGMGLKKFIETEKRVFEKTDSEFICRMYGAFQDAVNVYFLLEPVQAGEFTSLLDSINSGRIMLPEEAMFYAGCLMMAVEHLHDRLIACLDIKPENLLVAPNGYIKLCDFGSAKIFPDSFLLNDSNDQGYWNGHGTPEYMCPEVVKRDRIRNGITGLCG